MCLEEAIVEQASHILSYHDLPACQVPVVEKQNRAPLCSCFPVDGEPGSSPLQFTIYFKEGGVGTFIPLFFRLVKQGTP